jgi:hypothetical protein
MNLSKVVFVSLLGLSVTGISGACAKEAKETETVSNFLDKCPRGPSTNSGCFNEMDNDMTLWIALGEAELCSGATSITKTYPKLAEAERARIIAPIVPWFKAHPEMLNMDYYDAITKAFKALFPCRR